MTAASSRAIVVQRFAAWAVTVASVVALAVRYPTLPEQVVVRRTLAGTPMAEGSPLLLWLVLGIWVVALTVLTWGSTVPDRFSYPVTVTAANADPLHREAVRAVVACALAGSVCVAGVVVSTLVGPTGTWVTNLGLVGVAVAITVCLVRMRALRTA